MSSVRIGIIGAGGIARTRHLPGLMAIPNVQIVAVCNRSRESSERAAAEWGIPHVAASPDELIARDDIDAVLIGTWPYLHASLSIAALEAGRHVFCQARMARTAEEARRMLECARRHPDQAAMLCPPPHGLRWDRSVRRLLEQGILGEILEVHARSLSPVFADPDAPLHWRQDFDLQGWNTLTLGMLVEVIHRWLGPHASVAAAVRCNTPVRHDPERGESVEVRIADSVAIAAELQGGAIASYQFSGIALHPAEPAEAISIYGTSGTIHYNLAVDDMVYWTRDVEEPRRPDRSEAREWQVEADFIRAVREGGPVEPDFADGVLYMEFTEAVYEAARTGRRVDLQTSAGAATI